MTLPLRSAPRFRDARLTAFIEQVRAAAAGRPSDADLVNRVAQAASVLAGPRLELEPELRQLPGDGYGRNLIHRDAEHGFVVIAMVWPPGILGLPHDHGTWGVVSVAEGSVAITNYERRDDGSRAGVVDLAIAEELTAGPGAVATVLPPERDFHRVGNASASEPALTIHTYGRDVCRFHTADPATGMLTPVDARYTNAAGSPDEG